ncbi:MAG: type II toxin-antitoxin system YafQ family toxin, partial [Campylobacteraceae bacterium]|jgi:mRNA interferase YafQ|nr:type II toxin-antitoxin system YafQ family toxin [Campylobacteraceae bacterium]
MELTKELLTTLLNGEELPPKNRDHALKGRFKECRECHIKPDLLMIYQKQEDILILAALQIGKHSELF